MQLHRIEPHLHAKTFGMVRHSPIGWKQGKLSMPPAPSSTPSITRHHAACWLSLISPRYKTGRCTTRPPAQRRLSTMLQ
jgi:hypothetical protein